nr:hypothetical protein [Burkholderia ambifaria]
MKMMKKLSALAGLVLCLPVYAASNFCTVAGHYRGVYVGGTDGGTLEATVAATDGTLHGNGVSADGRNIPIAGVVTPGGRFSSGSAATLAKFDGGFLIGTEGRVYGRGTWSLRGNDFGTWQVVRDEISADCQ